MLRFAGAVVLGGAVALGGALAFGVAGCTRVATSSTPGSVPQRGADTLTLASTWEPDTLSPLLIAGTQAATIDSLLFSYLLNVDNDGNPVPEAAAVVPTQQNGGISRDGRTIRYHLRRDMRWSDGRPLTAHDVVFSFGAVMNPKNAAGSREGYDQVASIAAPDPYTVLVRLKRPYAPILLTLFAPNQNYALMPAHLLERLPSLDRIEFNAHPVGSGPYRFERWQHGDKLVLVRNPYYFGRRPAIERIAIKFVPAEQTILAQLQTHEIDGALGAGSIVDRAADGLKGYRVLRTPSPFTSLIEFNTEDPTFADVRVRRAFAMALDLPTIVRNATYGLRSAVNPARGLFAWSFDPGVRYPKYDPLGAAGLFAAAGWKAGAADGVRAKNGVPLEIELRFIGSGVAPRLATQIQAAEASAGVRVVLKSGTATELYSTKGPLSAGKFQAFIGGIANGPDPELVWLVTCSQRAPAGFNSMRYCSKAVDDAEAAGVATYDREARRRFYGIVQHRLAADVPILPLYQNVEIDVLTTRLHGYVPSTEGIVFQGVQNWSLATR